MNWFIALLARLALLVVWISTPYVNSAFHGGWLLPLLGILLLPITTLVYVLVFTLSGNGVAGWSWLWIVLAVLIDLSLGTHSASRQTGRTRKKQKSQPSFLTRK